MSTVTLPAQAHRGLINLKDEVGMALPQTAQTRFVGIVTSTIATSLHVLFSIIMCLCYPLSLLDSMHVEEIPILLTVATHEGGYNNIVSIDCHVTG